MPGERCSAAAEAADAREGRRVFLYDPESASRLPEKRCVRTFCPTTRLPSVPSARPLKDGVPAAAVPAPRPHWAAYVRGTSHSLFAAPSSTKFSIREESQILAGHENHMAQPYCMIAGPMVRDDLLICKPMIFMKMRRCTQNVRPHGSRRPIVYRITT